ncbi:MAG: carbon-nitrogen hydrolase family protein [Methanoregulaceae archaeon]|nr:carbon-nitrogen hydrolase family protein [Methanoregulaceae archaeon]
MKLFGTQMGSIWEDPEATLRKAEPFVRQAAEESGSLVCFPEQVATGWDPASGKYIQDRSGPVVTSFRNLARDNGIAILGSFREEHPGKPRNTCIVIGKNGEELASYAKCHLFTPAHEEDNYLAGTSLGVFDLDEIRFGLAICYDLRFSELFHIYAQRGVHAVIVPAAWPASRIGHWELFIRARALEHQIYVIGINTTGTNPVDCYNGHSLAADPSGTIVAQAGEEETLLPVSLEKDLVDRTRDAFPIARDRNPALYDRLLSADFHRPE